MWLKVCTALEISDSMAILLISKQRVSMTLVSALRTSLTKNTMLHLEMVVSVVLLLVS
jgi:hypothetical protein